MGIADVTHSPTCDGVWDVLGNKTGKCIPWAYLRTWWWNICGQSQYGPELRAFVMHLCEQGSETVEKALGEPWPAGLMVDEPHHSHMNSKASWSLSECRRLLGTMWCEMCFSQKGMPSLRSRRLSFLVLKKMPDFFPHLNENSFTKW